MKGQRRRGRGCSARRAARGLPLAPAAPAPIRAPGPAPSSGSGLGLSRSPGHSVPLLRPLSALPARPEQRAAALPEGGFRRPKPQAVGNAGGASVGTWEEGTSPRSPLRAPLQPLFSSPVPSYLRFSAELRPSPGVDDSPAAAAAGRRGGSGKRQVGES